MMRLGLTIVLAGLAVGCGNDFSDAFDQAAESCQEQLEEMLERAGRTEISGEQVEEACRCAVDRVAGEVGILEFPAWANVHQAAFDKEREGRTKEIEFEGIGARALMNQQTELCVGRW